MSSTSLHLMRNHMAAKCSRLGLVCPTNILVSHPQLHHRICMASQARQLPCNPAPSQASLSRLMVRNLSLLRLSGSNHRASLWSWVSRVRPVRPA